LDDNKNIYTLEDQTQKTPFATTEPHSDLSKLNSGIYTSKATSRKFHLSLSRKGKERNSSNR
jgi:hypothetical protein